MFISSQYPRGQNLKGSLVIAILQRGGAPFVSLWRGGLSFAITGVFMFLGCNFTGSIPLKFLLIFLGLRAVSGLRIFLNG